MSLLPPLAHKILLAYYARQELLGRYLRVVVDLAVDLFPAVSPLGLAEQVLVVGVAAVVQAQVLVAGDGYSDVLHHLEEDEFGTEGPSASVTIVAR